MRLSEHEATSETMSFICTDCGALSRNLSDRSARLACCQACGAARGTDDRLYELARRGLGGVRLNAVAAPAVSSRV